MLFQAMSMFDIWWNRPNKCYISKGVTIILYITTVELNRHELLGYYECCYEVGIHYGWCIITLGQYFDKFAKFVDHTQYISSSNLNM